MRRDCRLDAVRGLLLAEIAFVHTRVPAADYAYEFFGRVSTAAGFVFLSGLVAGAVYGRIADASLLDATKASVRRALFIHKYHVATFAVLALIALMVPRYARYFDFHWIGVPSEAWRSIVEFTWFAYQPRFFDILPLYALFVLAMPLALLGFTSNRSVAVMMVSLALWITAQCGIGDDRVFGGSYFNPLAWQLLYFSGLYFGYHQLHGKREIVRPQGGLILLCSCIAALGFTMRWDLIAWPNAFETGTFLANKTNHSPLYVVNFYAFVYLLFCLLKRFPNLLSIRPFVFLGKHSIQVFSFHILVVYLALPFFRTARHLSPWTENLLGLVIVVSLFIPAIIHRRHQLHSAQRREERVRRQASVDPLLPRSV